MPMSSKFIVNKILDFDNQPEMARLSMNISIELKLKCHLPLLIFSSKMEGRSWIQQHWVCIFNKKRTKYRFNSKLKFHIKNEKLYIITIIDQSSNILRIMLKHIVEGTRLAQIFTYRKQNKKEEKKYPRIQYILNHKIMASNK